jgi:CRISPR/Cas system-associated endoribonuclease Cas2
MFLVLCLFLENHFIFIFQSFVFENAVCKCERKKIDYRMKEVAQEKKLSIGIIY